jgi:hypothetical protein
MTTPEKTTHRGSHPAGVSVTFGNLLASAFIGAIRGFQGRFLVNQIVRPIRN